MKRPSMRIGWPVAQAQGHNLGAVFQIAGDWQLLVEARRGEFESLDQTLSIPIRKGS